MSLNVKDDNPFEMDDNIEASMAKVGQSGFDHINVDIHTMHQQVTAGVNLLDPTASGDYDDTAAVKDGTSIVYTKYVDSVTWGQYIIQGLWAQALTFNRYMRKTPSPAWWTPHTDTVLAYWIDNFTLGALDDDFPNIKNDATAATTLADAMEGISWDDEGVGTEVKHWQKLRKIAYAFGLLRRKDLPNITEKATDAQIASRTRWITIRAIRDVKKLVDLVPLMGLASDKAVLSLGKLIEGYVPSHVPKEMYGAEVDQKWLGVMDRSKDNVLGGTPFETSSKYKSFIQNYFDYTYLRSSDFDNIVRMAGLQIYVDADALKMARMFCGLGKTSINGEETFFLNLVNIMIETSAGAWDTHDIAGPTRKWFAGINTAGVLNFYDDPDHKDWYEGWEKVLKYDHWTGGALREMADDLVVTDLKSATKGSAEPDVYRALVSSIQFTDDDTERSTNLGWFEEPVVPDPTTNHTSSVVKYGATSSGMRALAHVWFFLMFVHTTISTKLKKRDGYGFFVNNWTDGELNWAFFIALMMGSGSATFDGGEKWNHKRLQLFSLLDGRINENVETICYVTTDTVRVRALINYLDWTNFPTFAMKYSTIAISAASRLTASEALYTAPRPRGIDGTTSRRRFNWGVPANQRNLIAGVLSKSSVTKPEFEGKASKEEDALDENEPSGKASKKQKPPPPKAKKKGPKPKASNVEPDEKPPTPEKDDD